MHRTIRSFRETLSLMTELGTDPALLAAAAEAVRSLLAKAAPADRRLAPSGAFPAAAMAAALSLATGRKVSGVVAVPGDRPFARPPGMPDESYARIIRESIASSTEEALAAGAGARFWDLCPKAGKVGEWSRIHDAIWYSVRPRLNGWAYSVFAEGAAMRAAETLDRTVHLLLGAAFLADRPGLDMILPLARLLTSGVPVGRSPADDSSWIVLAG